MPLQTLRRMASGGIYDQIGGGFARYSVDAAVGRPALREDALRQRAAGPRVPARVADHRATPLFRRVCEETLDWAIRELRQDEGGFASSLDADSEGVEGKFYVWTVDEIRAALGADLAEVAIAHFGVTEDGQLRGREHPRARDRRTRPSWRDQGGAARGARGAGAAGAGRQAADARGTR